jgi:hypothetical protein
VSVDKKQRLLSLVDAIMAASRAHAVKATLRSAAPESVSQADVDAARMAYEDARATFRRHLADD